VRYSWIGALILVALSVAVGCLGWSGNVALLPVAVLFPAIWSQTKTRRMAAASAAAYFLAAARGLPQGVANFYSFDIWPGLLLWLVASTAFVIVHCVLWTRDKGWRRPAAYLAAMIAMALPPFGITGWAHPITAAGVLFPGWGWTGLGAMAVGLMLMTTRYRFVAGATMACFWLWSVSHWVGPISPASWQGIDLQFGASLGREGGLERQEALSAIIRRHPPGTTVVLPESAIGFWTPTIARFWKSATDQAKLTLVAGATKIDADGYDNVLVHMSPDGGSILYLERMPVPVAMWQPWLGWIGRSGGAKAHVFTNPVVDIGETRVAPLICYEQLIVWPVLQSMLYDPDIVIAVGNGWWTAGTAITEIQRASTVAWARLFDKPLVLSFNDTSEPHG
jgi:hypothetical protein